MVLQISINLDNEAFQPDTNEVQRILRNLADKLTDKLPRDGHKRSIQDINGNSVGHWVILG